MSVVLDYTGGVFAAKPTGGSLGTDPAGDPNFADVSLLLHGDGTSGSTTITDSSSNAVVVTANGNTQIDTAIKKFGTGSIEFDGNGDYLTIPTSTNLQPESDNFTLECWVYVNDIDGSQSGSTLAGMWRSSPGRSWRLKLTGTGYALFANASTTVFSGSYNFLNTWTHVAWVKSGSTNTFYINGVSATSGTLGTYNNSSDVLVIGYNLDGAPASWYFDGYIDEFRITKGAARYTSNFTAPTAAFSNTGPTLDLSTGNTFVHAPSANVAYAFSNPPASGTAIDFTLKVTPSTTVTITWPSSVKWAGGTAPSAPASGETDAFTFYSTDGGTTYYGFHAGDAYS